MAIQAAPVPSDEVRGLARDLLRAARARYFKTPFDCAISILCIALIAWLAALALKWAVLDSVWSAGSAAECARLGSGACWAVLPARIRLILFGVFPYDEQWRAATGCILLLVACILSCTPPLWQAKRIAALWLGSFAIFLILMRGGVFGLTPVSTDNWGGLALTFLMFSSVMVVGLPLAILLALARWSGPRWLQAVAGGIVDFVRSIPLMAVLFAASLAVPMVVPAWMAGDKLTRVILGFALFFACYQAEIIRGGLQALDKGQEEAAIALGMKYWQYQFTVILPQVFRTVLPQTINQAVSGFKDTSYVAVVGFFDMTASASAALGTGDWALAYVEVYTVVGLIYLVLGYSLASYGQRLERRLAQAYRR